MKKIFIAVVLGVMVLGLQACGGGGSGSVTEVGTTEETIKNISSNTYYFTIQDAYNHASVNNDVIRVPARPYAENLEFGRDISVAIEGGCDASHSSCTGVTQLIGSIKANNGSVTMKNFSVH